LLKDLDSALEEMTANILVHSGLMEIEIPNVSRWDDIEKFTKQFWKAGQEQQKMQEYRTRLSGAIQDLMVSWQYRFWSCLMHLIRWDLRSILV
jgi:hypothetical protein